MNVLSRHYGLTGSQNALVLASGECWGENTAMELRIGKATQLHLRRMTNNALAYSKGNSVLC